MEYRRPQMHLLEFEEEDVITLSIGGDGTEPDIPGSDDSWWD